MRTIDWDDDREDVVMVDQTKLPSEYTEYHAETVDELVESIRILRVRGAPALGAAGGYGVALASREVESKDYDSFLNELSEKAERVADARPTAVNLSRGVEEVMEVAKDSNTVEEAKENCLRRAKDLADADVERNRQIGENGATLLEDDQTVMTHCNAGALATVDWGTALGVVYSAHQEGKEVDVVANETRPLNQGSRITTVELLERDVETTLIPDNASGLCMQNGMVDAVIVGADRIVLDGREDFPGQGVVFNKIGTYKHAVIADRHDIPFIVAAPRSTVDENSSADEVEIEQRERGELTHIYGTRNAPEDVDVHNPAFDPTPMELVDYVVTEHGVFKPPVESEKIIQSD